MDLMSVGLFPQHRRLNQWRECTRASSVMMRQFAVAESKMFPSGDRKTRVRVNLAFSDIGLNVPQLGTFGKAEIGMSVVN